MKRGRRKKGIHSEGQIAFDEMDGQFESYKNIKSGQIFVRYDDDSLINPTGKIVEYRSQFYEEIKLGFYELSEAQQAALWRLQE